MSVQIKSVDLVVPGHVVRKNDESGNTVLTLTGEQVVAIFESTAQIADLFPPTSTSGTPSVPLDVPVKP